MSSIEYQYLNLLGRIKSEGHYKDDRTGVGCYSIWGASLRHNFGEEGFFPLITTKRMWWHGIKAELLWMLSGEDNIQGLEELGAPQVWKPWAREDGSVGQIYGPSWRNWDRTGLDQVQTVINEIKTNPNSRRQLVVAWNPSAVWSNDVCLPPCHIAYQFQVQDGRLNANWVMRSSDFFVGAPWNLAFYALLQCMIAQVCKLQPGVLTYWGNDVHLYRNHLEAASEQLRRGPLPLPKLRLNPAIEDIDSFRMEDIVLEGYNPHPALKVDVAV